MTESRPDVGARMRLGDLAVILGPLFEGTHSEAFMTLRFPEDGTLVQCLHEADALHLYLNTSGDGGSFEELLAALEGLDVEVHRLDGHEGTEHVTLRGPVTEAAQRAIRVIATVFGKSTASEVEVVEGASKLRTAAGGRDVSMRWSLVAASLGLLVVGGLAVGAAMLHSRTLTGQWIGSPLPTATEAAMGLGGLGLLFGTFAGAFWALLQVADRTALGDLLHRPLVGDHSRRARASTRVVRGIISLSYVVKALQLLGAAVLVLWLAHYDDLIAWILGITGVALLVVHTVGRHLRAE